jgi:hypothetical protein
MKANKDLKRYDRWTREEAKQFLNTYFDTYTYRTQHYCCERIADSLGRTIPAVKFRVGEVRSILTDGKKGQPISRWTSNMIVALDEFLHERNLKVKDAIKIF